MLEKRRSRGGGGGGGGSSVADNWNAPPVVKAQMAFEIIWFCIILYLISTLIKIMRNVPSRERQPYILLLVSAIFFDIALIMRAVAIRINDTSITPTSIALDSTIRPLYQQATVLFTMAGLWVFRKRSKLIIYGKGARGIPYAGQMWKFVADWTVTSCSLLFLTLSVIVNAAGTSLLISFEISYLYYLQLFDAQLGLTYVQFAFYSILTIVFVVTGLTLTGAFNQQTGRSDVVTRQMLIWVMPWLIIYMLYTLIDYIIYGMNVGTFEFDFSSLTLARLIVNGACWTGVLFGFIKTAADPGPWDWSHIQSQQPQIAQYGVQAGPPQPSYYGFPVAPPPQGQQGWGQNNNPHQYTYHPSAPPHVQV